MKKAKYNPNIHHRKSIRLKEYDYSQAGLYFLTICTQHRECLFGEIVHDEMVFNVAGQMINQIWLDMPNQHNNIKLHEYIVMPNHFHGIIEIVGAESISAQSFDVQSVDVSNARANSKGKNKGRYGICPYGDINADIDIKLGLSDFVQTFKRFTTIEYIKRVKQNILPPFNKKIWQRNYWEHIIRNKNEYHQISDYIKNNPAKWDDDQLNDGIGNLVMESKVEYKIESWMV